MVTVNRLIPVVTFIVATATLATVASAQFFSGHDGSAGSNVAAIGRSIFSAPAAASSWFGDTKTETVITVRPPRKRPRFAASSSPAYCVRSCDGFYFPIGQSRAGLTPDRQQQVCTSLCPGAKMTVYRASGDKIEQALSPKGEPYAKLAVAFRFRNAVAPSCSCQKNPAEGLAHLAINEDDTLRRGDIVVTKRGARVFKGSKAFPYSDGDFVDTQMFGRMPSDALARIRQIDRSMTGAADTARERTIAQRARLSARAQVQAVPERANTDGIRVIDLSSARETNRIN